MIYSMICIREQFDFMKVFCLVIFFLYDTFNHNNKETKHLSYPEK